MDIKVITGSDAYTEALMKEPPKILNWTTIRLIGCLLLGCFCQTMNGFDGSLFNGLLANKHFLNFFNGSSTGVWAAYNSAMYQIGGVCALPFVGPAVDTWGRRVGMSIGAWIIIIGAIINGTTLYDDSLGQLKAGRFILGFGVSIVSAAGPIYVVETAHPAWRGVVTAYCNTFWFVGAILAAGAVRGALSLGGTISWQIPIWLQVSSPFNFESRLPTQPKTNNASDGLPWSHRDIRLVHPRKSSMVVRAQQASESHRDTLHVAWTWEPRLSVGETSVG